MRGNRVTVSRYAVYRRFAALDQEFHDIPTASPRPTPCGDCTPILHMFRLSSVSDAGERTVAEYYRIRRAVPAGTAASTKQLAATTRLSASPDPQ
jgi:hypothetical protein